MHRAKQIFTTFFGLIEPLQNTSLVEQVVKTNIDTEENFPMLSVSIGGDTREDWNKGSDEFNLTIFVDIFTRANSKIIDEQMLDIREVVENTIYQNENLGLDYVFEIEFVGQSAPNYNDQGTEYSSSTRLEWRIRYLAELNNASI